MVKKTITRELPDFLFISKNELTGSELFELNHVYSVDKSEFVICRKSVDSIVINKDLIFADKLKELVISAFNCKYLDKAEPFFNEIEELLGAKTARIVIDLWLNWREKKRDAELKRKADKIIKQARAEGATRAYSNARDTVKFMFDLGFGLFDKKETRGFDEGGKYCFLYGYMLGLKKGAK